MRTRIVLMALVASALAPRPAAAQLDPLLFLKNVEPNVLVLMDTANRMQRDADDNYYDPFIYSKTNAAWEAAINVNAVTVATNYRRKYVGLAFKSGAAEKFEAQRIETVGDKDVLGYLNFEAKTRLSVARVALTEAISRNMTGVRWSLLKTRQNNPLVAAKGTSGLVNILSDVGQQATTDGSSVGKWQITRTTVGAPPYNSPSDGSINTVTAPMVSATTYPASNTSVLGILAKDVRQPGPSVLVPAGLDDVGTVDAPIDHLLEDAKVEALKLVVDIKCRNTVAILVTGGAEGNTSPGADPVTRAADFLLNLLGRRVPIFVIAIAPKAGDVAQLQSIASKSGGVYTEITKTMIETAGAGKPVPEIVNAVNYAVSKTLIDSSNYNIAPTAALPFGPGQEYQTASPIVGTVDLNGAKDITGNALPNTNISNPSTSVHIPQRSNLLVTSGFTLPGFAGSLRGFRTYKPVVDTTKSVGYKFVQDGTRLWEACAPGTTTTGPCASLAPVNRNIYTVLPNGSVVSFDPGNATALRPYLNMADDVSAASLITAVRQLPLGAIVDSTPAIMDPPSLDPPPDADYPGFADTNEGRRSIVWVGANDGMLHAIDARLGIEVWAYIPFNLLPKLYTLRSGQPFTDFRYFVDGSAKVADVKINGVWRTYLVMGEGPGGTFYQAFDVTLDGMGSAVASDSNDISSVLGYFADPTRIAFKWSFPSFSNFNPSIRLATQPAADLPWGDLAASASAVEKTVGETWSDPAVGEILNNTGGYAVLMGSGFLKWSIQQQPNRAGAVAGNVLYVLDARSGAILDSKSVGSDGLAETNAAGDSCAAVNDCTKMKNALQADVVATGPPDSRYITKAYVGDLDGRLWRFDITMSNGIPKIVTGSPTKLYDATASQPMFGSMASVTVGGTQQYLFQGTGSDLLPSNGVSQSYALLVILDNGATGSKTAQIDLAKTDGSADDEKVTAFPAVAGDIVFFTTTSFYPTVYCGGNMTANLYAFTFIGGPAYDTNGDGTISTKNGGDTTKVSSTTNARATAPFVVDQHLGVSVGGKVQMFGDPNDYNNGVGQVGVRILSWREVR